jgi:hypothetical protein
MQLLKIGFILSLVGSLCSFAYYSAQDDSREQLYKEFLSQFEQVDLPSKITLEAYIVTNEMKPAKRKKQLEKAKSEAEVLKVLTKEYAPFIPEIEYGMMSRMGPSTYKAELALATTGKYSAVIYSKSRSFDGGAKSYVLATFDGHGTPIETQYLGYSDLEEKVELTISKKMELRTKRLRVEGTVNGQEREIKNMFITSKGEILVHEEDEPSDKIEPVQKKANLKFS